MKKDRLDKKILSELEKVPNISIACEKCGVSRQAIYRWMREDFDFKEKVEKALDIGTESICDLAESKLVSNINIGHFPSIKYWLDSHKKAYYRPRKPLPQKEDKYKTIETIEFIETDPEGTA